MKYFIKASEQKIFFEFIKGIIESRLISNPIHILSHENDEIEIKVPRISVLKNKIL